jgi:hypothetical protein
MNATHPSTPTSRHTANSILRAVVVVTLGAAVYSTVSSQLGPMPVDDTIRFIAFPAGASTEPGSGMPAPSSTATEGNVVDLTYPQS